MITLAILAFNALTARAQVTGDPNVVNITFENQANSNGTPSYYYCGGYSVGKGHTQPLSSLDDWPDSLKLYWAAMKHGIAGNNVELQKAIDTMHLYIQLHPFAETGAGMVLDAIGEPGGFISEMSNNRADSSVVWKREYNWLIHAMPWNLDTPYQYKIWGAMANDVVWDLNFECNLIYNHIMRFHDTESWAGIRALRQNERGMHPPMDTTPFYIMNFPPDTIPINGTAGVTTPASVISSSLALDPNPASSMLTVDFTLSHGGQAVILIYDEAGKAVRSVVNGPRGSGANSTEVSLADLPNGHYFVRFASGEDVVTKELIVQH